MADLEAVLADMSYLMAMEMSKSTPAARASKKITLPDPRCVGRCLCRFLVLFGMTSISCLHIVLGCDVVMIEHEFLFGCLLKSN